MKKNLFTILFLASIATNLFAQSTTTSDSLSMTIGTAVDVYYNLQTGKKILLVTEIGIWPLRLEMHNHLQELCKLLPF